YRASSFTKHARSPSAARASPSTASAFACCAVSATVSPRSVLSRCRARPSSRMPSPSGQARHFNAKRLGFAGRLRVQRERMHGTREFARKRRIYHAMTFDPALPFEGLRHNIDPKVRLPARPMAGMALMQMRFVLDLEAFGKESFAQLVGDNLPCSHVTALNLASTFRQCRARS